MAAEQPRLACFEASGLAGALFRESGDALLVVEPGSARVLDANPEALRLTQLSPDELLRRTIGELIRPEQGSEEWLGPVLQSGTRGQDGFLLRRAEGWRPVALSVAPLDVPGQAPLALFALRDAGDLAEALGRHEAARLEGLAAVTSGIGHDFNNLLTGILGNAALARLACPAGSPALPLLGQVEGIAGRAAALCQQLLICAGRGGPATGTCDLNAVVRDAVGRARLAAPPSLDLAGDLPPVRGAAAALREALTQLLLNAAEAVARRAAQGPPGEVRVRTWRGNGADLARPGWLSPGSGPSLPADGSVLLEVRDNGPGLPAEVRHRLFEPFFTTRPNGRGLGLALVLGVVRQHRGGIRVETAAGHGMRVQLCLPLAVDVPAPTTGQGQQVSPALVGGQWGQATVLVVDDEPAVRDIAIRLLSSLGCRTVAARDGREALEKYRGHPEPIDLVLLDLTMPQLGGEEVLRELRRLDAHVPVVVMSGHSEPESSRLAALGASGYLHKPFRVPALIEVLRRSLPPERSRQSS
jgi:signal transduction histidine kinase/ActR/RegA family two-component response regulator